MSQSRRPIAARHRLRSEDRGSLPLLMLVMLVGTILSGLMVPIIITQTATTKFTSTRDQALDAAQAGVDVVAGMIRNAADGSGTGHSAALPCWTHALNRPYQSPVNSVGSGSFSVYVDYYTVDPVKNPAAQPMTCSPGYGPYQASTGTATPSYALITSTGTDGPAGNGTTKGRTIVSTYIFKTSNVNIAGGVIRLYPASGATTNVCLDAGTGTPDPSTTTPIYLQVCSTSTPPIAQQVFSYRSDLTIQLSSSVTKTNPNGLCLDSNAPLANGNTLYLKQCQTLGSPPYDQQWSFNDNGHFQGSTSSSKINGSLSTVCINAASQSAGQAVTVATCAGSVSDPAQSWIPAPSVGAGAADDPQYVNYLEFGRCMDVTGQNVNADHFIDYPCKQNPYAGAVAWNQKFTYNALTSSYGQLTTITGAITYCITSPTLASGTVYPTLVACNVANTMQRWTRNGGNSALPYSAMYNIIDSAGRCLGLTTPVGSEVWSAVDVETCTGALDQKWNAAPGIFASSFQNTKES